MQLIQSGPRDTKIVIVGEAPGATEWERKIPFCGGSGDLLNEMLGKVGLLRDECFVTNVCHHRPPGNDFDWFWVKENFAEHWVPGVTQLRADLAEIRPNVVIALGGEALRALCGGKQPISDWRGSILECALVPGLKVIPTYHPAATFRVYELRHILRFDFQRAAKQAQFPEIRRPPRTLHLDPDDATREQLISEMFRAEWLAIDIETTPRHDGRWNLVTVQFSDRPDRALVIKVDEHRDYIDVKFLCESSAKKILQNGQYDATVLREFGIEIHNYVWDTMVGHHTLYIEAATGGNELQATKTIQAFAKGLAFQTSLYTEEPFYKADSKTAQETGDKELFYTYGAKDAAVTFEIKLRQDEELVRSRQADLFVQCMRQHEPFMRAMWRGIAIDTKAREQMAQEVETKREALQAELDALAGWPVNVKSNPQMAKLLYDQLGLRAKKFSDKTGLASASKDAIVALAIANPDVRPLQIIRKIREQRDLAERYLQSNLDEDGRIRCAFDLTGTRTGRLASRESIYGSGANLQNQPPFIRRMFVADEGKIFVQRDYSQAEAREVAYEARCGRLIELFSDPTRDIHRENAAAIFKTPLAEVTYLQRYLAKRGGFLSNYGGGADRLAEAINEDYEETGIKVTSWQMRHVQDGYFGLYPEIRSVYWRRVEDAIRGSGSLRTPLGRLRTFYGRWDAKFLREAYSFIPQSTVGDLCRMACANVYYDLALARPELGVELLLNVHDSILVQCYEGCEAEVAKEMERCMAIPITTQGQTFTLPSDCQVGHNWGAWDAETNPDGLKKFSI